MNNYRNYFSKNRPKPKWFIGDRVFGNYNKIPFTGTVLNDGITTDEFVPVVSIYLDLPLKYKKEYKNIIFVNQKSLKKLKEIT